MKLAIGWGNMQFGKNYFNLLLAVTTIFLIASCASVGDKNLTPENMDRVTEGKTTKNGIIRIFGYPSPLPIGNEKPIKRFDHMGLKNYLYSLTLREYNNIPPGKYEAWRYWYHFSGISPIPGASRDKDRIAIFIFNEEDVVVSVRPETATLKPPQMIKIIIIGLIWPAFTQKIKIDAE